MINSMEDPDKTDYQYFNLQYAASGYQLLSAEKLKEKAERGSHLEGYHPDLCGVTT